MDSAKLSYRDITCKLVPGFPPPFLFFVGARGEPGNEGKPGYEEGTLSYTVYYA